MALSFEILSPSLNALPVSHQQFVKAVLEVSKWQIPQGSAHSGFHILDVVKAMSPDLGFQDWEGKVITRRQIRAVLWVWPQPLSHVYSKKICQSLSRSVGGGVVLEEVKVLVSPKAWSPLLSCYLICLIDSI